MKYSDLQQIKMTLFSKTPECFVPEVMVAEFINIFTSEVDTFLFYKRIKEFGERTGNWIWHELIEQAQWAEWLLQPLLILKSSQKNRKEGNFSHF